MASPSRKQNSHGDPTAPDQRPLEILLAEDCAVNALLATTLLRQLGHRITRATNGREAIEKLHRQHFDVLLLDLQLPEIDGFAVAAALRANESDETRVPIIAVTALADVESVRRLKATGIDGYLEKPLRLPALETALERALCPTPGLRPLLPSTDQDGLDLDALLLEVGGDTRLLQRMLEIFREQSAEQIESIRAALDRGDATAVAAAAHALKGGIANFERAGAYTSAARLESLAAGASLEAAPGEYARLLGELGALDRELVVLESCLGGEAPLE